MKTLLFLFFYCFTVFQLFSQTAVNLNAKKPNVIILYFDDMGYGDMGANGETGLTIPKDSKYLDWKKPSLTPNLDSFAEQSVRFTNGHSSDGVCSPSRYSLITGHYSWRTSLKKGVTGGYSPTFMGKNRFTVAHLFKKHGYKTAMVGKSHMGMTFYDVKGKPYSQKSGSYATAMEEGFVDFSRSVDNSPISTGFDYWFGTPASLDMPPYAWLESKKNKVNVLYKGGVIKNNKVDFSQAQFAKNSDFEVIKKNDGVHARAGAKDPTFAFEDYLQIQSQKVRDLFAVYEKEKVPFMIYIPMPAPHSPHAIQKKFEGETGYEYGDYVVQTDYYAGEIIKALGDVNDPNSLASNTVIFITSDNGPEIGAFNKSKRLNHDANGPWAGIKRDNYEGGTRVPFMVRWPGVAKPSVTNHPCWQGDFLGTMADFFNYELEKNEAPDVESFLPILKGKKMPRKRRAGFIEHSSGGQFAFVEYSGEWKLIDGTGGGGNATTADADNNKVLKEGEIGGAPRQLFNLKRDPGERDNLLVDDPNNPNDNNDPSKKSIEMAAKLYNSLNKIRGDKMWGVDIKQ